MDGSTYALSTRTTWCNNRNTDLAGGTLVLYDGPQAATPDTAIGGTNHVLATLAIPNPAGVVAADTLTLNAMAAALIARAGVANWGRFFSAAAAAIIDGPVCNQTVTLSAGAALNATALAVVALTKPLYAGMTLVFNDGGVLKTATLTADAVVGATALAVSALAAAISNGASNVYAVAIDAPNLAVNAALAPGAITLQAPGA